MGDAAGTSEPLLKTDNLEKLQEGEIYTDPETGKKYRVKKTIMPHYASGGPHGYGDPNDRTLRRIEADVIVPNRMNTQIEKVECRPHYLDLVHCMRDQGAVRGLQGCKSVLTVFNKCKFDKFHDPAFRERITEEYLEERSAARRTGMTAKQRKLEEFREWKRQHPEAAAQLKES